MSHLHRQAMWLTLGAWALGMASATLRADPSLSLDGDSVSSLPVASPAGPGDVLDARPGSPPPPVDFPSVRILASDLGIDSPLGLDNIAPDLDALSYNRVAPLGFNFRSPQSLSRLRLFFSVDRAALGAPGTAVEAETVLFADDKRVRLAAEPAADVFLSILDGSNARIFDGDGYDGYDANSQPVVAPVPGLGLNEGLMSDPPNFIPPLALSPPTNNLNALDLRRAPNRLGGTAVFFSVDPLGAAILSSNLSAGVNLGAVSGGDVLVSRMNGTFVIYARAEQLGLVTVVDPLDPTAGAVDRTVNNIDALVVFDDGVLVNGMPVFNPATDVVIFSLDQSSALVQSGQYLAGDVLISSTAAGGLPIVLAPAEDLGLFVLFSDPILGQTPRLYSDELDALDLIIQ